MPKSTWKATERRIAKRLGCDRVPVADKRSGTDAISEHLAVEVKHRKTVPAWLKHAVSQATDAAQGDQLPIAIIHQLNENGDRDLVLMDMQTFETFLKAHQDIMFLKVARPDDYESIF